MYTRSLQCPHWNTLHISSGTRHRWWQLEPGRTAVEAGGSWTASLSHQEEFETQGLNNLGSESLCHPRGPFLKHVYRCLHVPWASWQPCRGRAGVQARGRTHSQVLGTRSQISRNLSHKVPLPVGLLRTTMFRVSLTLGKFTIPNASNHIK